MSGPICECAVSALCVCYMLLLSLLAWVDPSVSGLYLTLVCALYVLVVFLSISKPICELAVSALRLHYMHFLSLSAWVDPSVSGLYLPCVCVICSCCHSQQEWTHLWVGCICVICSCCHSRHEWTHLWVSCICIAFALYALFVPLGMSGPICEWAVSSLRLHYKHFLSLSAWVDASVSGLYLPCVCVICSCCPSRHEWTHLWVCCICLVCVLYVVTLGMSEPICELAVSASRLHYMHFLSLLAWADPSVSGLYLPLVCVICTFCPSWHK